VWASSVACDALRRCFSIGNDARVSPSPFQSAAERVRKGADPNLEAQLLVSQMTPDEQLGCLDGDLPFWPGLFDMTSGGYYRHPWPAAVVDRLGIPGIHFADGPRGCVIGHATAFPVAMARGASFDPALEEAVGVAIGSELRASGATYTGAVCMNLLRHPAWGRAQETYGEDPEHVGQMARALMVGLQRHVMSCMKHFALNSMENARFTVDVHADERALHEVYLPHFKMVADAGVASVMSAYNSLNGEWCGENVTLLTSILRDEWGWQGAVISDFIFGLRDAAKSVKAGLDIEMPFQQQRARDLQTALDEDRLSMADVTASVTRTVAMLLRYAWVFNQQPPTSVIASAAHTQLARRAASDSMVLVANDGLLPRPVAEVQSIAVLGRLADTPNLGDGGSSDVHPPYVVTPLAGLRSAYPTAVVTHSDDDASIAQGADLTVVIVGYTKADEGEYVDAAGTAAVAGRFDIFPAMDHPTLGASAAYVAPPDAPTCEPQTTPGPREDRAMAPGGDRDSIRLSAVDEALIAAAAAVSAKVVVCVMAGSAVVMPWADQVAAVLMLWYPGMEGGSALGDVLSGVSEPGGRLPFAVPKDEADLVRFDRNAEVETYDLFHGQWKLDRDGITPHFRFGHGLGYTTWEVEATSVEQQSATIRVRNTGGRAGSTVALLYASVPSSAYERPIRRLVGFAKLRAEAGETAAATIAADIDMLRVRINGEWVTENADVVLSIELT
jgi:beta-glucosidase